MKYLSVVFTLFISACALAQVDKINVGVYEIEYEYIGTGENIILLEAGMTRDLQDWDIIVADLATMAQVIRYSRVGNGNSTQTEQHFSAEQYAEQTKGLLDALKIKKANYSYLALLWRHNCSNICCAISCLSKSTVIDRSSLRT